ncbi:MAG: rod shape-determining protein MreC [Paludibacteraceae bacterium]|jgi:rod shape-determining protein MreC|nr:rod shape-determining protein MreC [Paludibacteraceae bacterium]
MHNLWHFIEKHSNFLLLLILEVVAFFLIIGSHRFQSGNFFNASNYIVASINQRFSNVASYFSLTSLNDKLHTENALLYEQMHSFHLQNETLKEKVMLDSISTPKNSFHYIPAMVVDFTTNQQHNYIILNKGRNDNLREGMGVVCEQGVIGTIKQVSNHYSIVMPMINTDTHISCRIKKNNYVCFTQWNGVHYDKLNLTDIARHINITPGDTIITSGYSQVFPEGMLVGVVEDVQDDESESYLEVQMHTYVDFRSLKYVYAIDNPLKVELDSVYHSITD